MDVRCERCRTEYEFDDARITEAGVTVKCTVCNHIFKVKKKSLLVTIPVKPEELAELAQRAAAPEPPAEPAAPPREWKVRQANGNVFSFKELTTLQKWIIERKVSRDDEISLTGESWKRLGNIAELASFFQVVEAADRATASRLAAHPPEQVATPPLSTPEPGPRAAPAWSPPVASPASANWEMQAPGAVADAPVAAWEAQPTLSAHQAPAAAWESERPATVARIPDEPVAPPAPREPAGPRTPEPRPTPAQPLPAEAALELTDAELAAVRGRPKSAGRFALLAAIVLAIAGAGFFAWKQLRPPTASAPSPTAAAPAAPEAAVPAIAQPPFEPPQAAVAAAEKSPPAADRAEGTATPAVAEPSPPAAPAGTSPDPQTGEAEIVQAAPASPAPVPAPEPKVVQTPEPRIAQAPEPKTVPAAAPEPKVAATGAPSGKSFSWYLQQGLSMRERGQTTQALKMYEKAAELMPESAEPMTGKGFCLFDLERYNEARASFESALRVNPRFSDALLGIGEVLKEQGNDKGAIEYYRRYLDVAPGGPDANLARANIERLGGN